MHPSALTTAASLSATDPAIFLHGAPGCTAGGPAAAGDVGRGARAGIPGRSCAGRGRGSEAGRARAHTHRRAGAHAWGQAPTRQAGPGRRGRGAGGGAGREVGGGRSCPDGDCRVGAAFFLGVLLSPPEAER